MQYFVKQMNRTMTLVTKLFEDKFKVTMTRQDRLTADKILLRICIVHKVWRGGMIPGFFVLLVQK